MTTLDGAVAIVTGASTGIGNATARALAAEGMRVALAARSTAKLEALAGDVEASGGEALVVPTDVRERAQIEAMVATTRETYGGLDVLVNSAGVGHWDRLRVGEADLDEWRTEIEVNLIGLMEATHVAARIFLEQGSGHVVNVSSGAGRIAFPQIPSYVASKFGVDGFTRAVRRDLVPKGIRVTQVVPGEVDTPMQDGASEADRAQMLRPEDVADAIVYAVSRPAHVTVNDVMLVPTAFNPSDDYE